MIDHARHIAAFLARRARAHEGQPGPGQPATLCGRTLVLVPIHSIGFAGLVGTRKPAGILTVPDDRLLQISVTGALNYRSAAIRWKRPDR